MGNTERILSDYYGALYYIKENKDKELTIFIVDDDPFYLNLLEKELSKNKKYEIFSFKTGESCLNSLQLNPDLIILDYHLDTHQPKAKNGEDIAQEIKKRSPHTETMIISSDYKLALVNKLSNSKVLFKDNFVKEKIKSRFIKQLKSRRLQKIQEAIYPTIIVLFIIISLIVYIKI